MQLLESHIRKLKNDEQFVTSNIILAIENNYGNDAIFHQMHFKEKNIPNVIVMKEGHTSWGTTDWGIRTTNASKMTCAIALNFFVEESAVYFYDKMVVTNPKKTRRTMIEDLHTQLINFTQETEISTDIAKKPKIKFSGKRHGPDDLAMMLQMNVYAHQLYQINKDKYT